MNCPNKSTPEWKALTKAYGEGTALALFHINQQEIPSLEQAQSLLLEEEGSSVDALINPDEPYYTITPKKNFEEKQVILEQSAIKSGRWGYYYVLDKEQEKRYKSYLSRSRGKSPADTKKGFTLSENIRRNVTLKTYKGKPHIYIDLKELYESEGVMLPRIYGRVKVAVEVVASGEEQTYLNAMEKDVVYIPEREREIRREYIKTKGVGASRASSFYLLQLQKALSNILKQFGVEESPKSLANIEDGDVEYLKSVINLDEKVDELKQNYREKLESLDEDELREEIISLYVDNYDKETVDGIWNVINYLPASFLRLLSFEYINEPTAFFKGDSDKNKTPERISLLELYKARNIVLGLGFNIAVRDMVKEGVLTQEEVEATNEALRPQIEKYLDTTKDIKDEDLKRYYRREYVKKFQTLWGVYAKSRGLESPTATELRVAWRDKKAAAMIEVYNSERAKFSVLYDKYHASAVNEIDKYNLIKNKGLVELTRFVNTLQHKELNKVYTGITLGDFSEVRSLKFPIDYTVIAAHELGHAVDFYMTTTRPYDAQRIRNFVQQLLHLPAFEDYIEKGLKTRNYEIGNRKEIIADVFAWMMARGANYDISKSHIASLDKFMEENVEDVNRIFLEIFPEFQPTETPIGKKVEPSPKLSIIAYIKKIIREIIDSINKMLGIKHYELKPEGITEAKPHAASIKVLLKALDRITMRDENFNLDDILNSDNQRSFWNNSLQREEIAFNRNSLNKNELSGEKKVVFERLQRDGFITKKQFRGDYFIPKMKNEVSVSYPFIDYRQKFNQYAVQDDMKVRLEAIIKSQGLDWLQVETDRSGNHRVRIVQDRQQDMMQRASMAVGKDAFTNLADRLSKRLNVPYKIITASEAQKITEDSQIPYNGEGAFVYKGTVYVLEEALSLENAIHEFGHFFIRAIHKQSPYLVQKLYNELKNDSEGKELVDYVNRKYADFDAEHRMEEVLVRALTLSGLKMVDNEGNVLSRVVKKLLDAIKRIIKDLFGISLKNLHPDTTLDQLAALMLSDEGGTIDLSNASLFSDAFPSFNRDIAQQLEKLDSSNVKNAISSFYTVTKEHMDRLKEDRNLSALREIFRNETNSTIIKDEKELLKMAEQFSQTLDQDRLAINSFAQAIEGLEVISTKMRQHVKDFDYSGSEYTTQQKIAIFRKYSFMAREWMQVLDSFNRAIEKSSIANTNNPLSASVLASRSHFNFINNEIKEFYQKEGLTKIFKEEISSNIYYIKTIQEQKDRISGLKEVYFKEAKAAHPELRFEIEEGRARAYKADGMPVLGKDMDKVAALFNKKVQDKLFKQVELLSRYELTEEKIGEYLAGLTGDTNPYSMYLESYSSNPDPIVGLFSTWFFQQKHKAQTKAQERLTKFENKVSRIMKKLGYKPGDFQKIAQNLVQLETTYAGFEEGEHKDQKVWKLINQYANDKDGIGWEYEAARLEKEVEQAKERVELPSPIGGWDNYHKKKKALEEFKMKYMFDAESDKVKESRLFWLRDAITIKAKERRDEIIQQMRENRFKDLTRDEVLEKIEQNKHLRRRLSQLSALRNEDGSEKPEEDLKIALAIKEHYEKYGDLYQDLEINGLFEANLASFREQTIDELLQKPEYESIDAVISSREFKSKIQNWYRENIRISNSPAFYEERQKSIDIIKSITAKISDEKLRGELDIGERWQQIIDISRGFRDEDGQPIGTDMSQERIKAIRKLQEEINDIKEEMRAITGLEEDEDIRFHELSVRYRSGDLLTSREYREYKALKDKRNDLISEEDQRALKEAFDDLKALQTKVSTPYYANKVNSFLSKQGSDIVVTPFNANSLLEQYEIEPLLQQDPEFKKWWDQNHILVSAWDPQLETTIEKYERLYIWNRYVPNDEMFQTLLETENFEGLINYKSPYITIQKSSEYYFRALKPEYEVQKKTGITVDNRGKWLPRPTEASATTEQKEYMREKGISFADDNRFENKRYLQMRTEEKDNFELLQAYTDFHLETQQSLQKYARLGLEIPRMRKNVVESVNLETLSERPKEWWKNLSNWAGAMFGRKIDDYELGTGNYDPKAEASAYTLTDIFGNQIASIPIKYKTMLDPELVSMDIGKAVSMYAVSAETNKMLHEISPIANALKETLVDNPVKDNTKNSKKIIDLAVNGVMSVTQRPNQRGTYRRLQAIENFLERELEGVENIQQFGAGGEKAAHMLMKIGAIGSLGLNVFAAIKNDIAGNVQNGMEAVLGNNIDTSSLLRSQAEMVKLTGALTQDYYKIGDKSLMTQLFMLFDPMNTFDQRAGTNFSKTVLRDALQGRFIMAGQKFGELHIQGGAWLAMMAHQKVETSEVGEDGKPILISYLDAWEMGEDGVIKLKDNVSKKWDKGGKNFLQFVTRMNKVNEFNQGAYSDESQPEVARYTLGKLFLFMRKFFIPGIMNRFSKERFNYAMGEYKGGYWRPFFEAARQAAKGNIKSVEDLKTIYTHQELRMMMRMFSEVGFVALLGLLIAATGFDDDDEDKYEKLREKSWIHNFLLYQIMMIKSETETFIPFPGMGVNEAVRLLGTPTIAFTTFRRWVKVGQDFLWWVSGEPDAYYQQDSGIYEEGQLKLWADILNIVGWKNFAYLTDNQDLTEGIKQYVQMQRRI
jgi:hypothetical protein